MESYPKAIHIFLDSGVRIGYPKISGESECLLQIESFFDIISFRFFVRDVNLVSNVILRKKHVARFWAKQMFRTFREIPTRILYR